MTSDRADRAPWSVIDLTRTLTPMYPTAIRDIEPVRSWESTTYDSHGFQARSWSMIEHIATHVDAPVHFIEGGRTVPELSAQELVVPGRVIDFGADRRSDVSPVVTIADLERDERDHGPIAGGSAVLLHTGFDGSADAGPGWSGAAVEWLIAQRGIVALGTDTSSIDAGWASDAEAHRALLEADRYAIEGLTGLDQLIGGGPFWLVVGVQPWSGATGAPCRVFALSGLNVGGDA